MEVPFVSCVVDCDGTSVRANLRNVEPDDEHVHTGMRVGLTTYSLGTDDNGVEAIGFGFEVQQHPVPQHVARDRVHVLGQQVPPALQQRVGPTGGDEAFSMLRNPIAMVK